MKLEVRRWWRLTALVWAIAVTSGCGSPSFPPADDVAGEPAADAGITPDAAAPAADGGFVLGGAGLAPGGVSTNGRMTLRARLTPAGGVPASNAEHALRGGLAPIERP